jgi:hypothetical protein
MGTVNISWTRLFAEGSAIVVGILLAFAIDAWWQERQEQAADHAHLSGVYDELSTHKNLMAEAIVAHQATLDYGTRLLQIISLPGKTAAESEIPELINGMINFYRINAPFGSLETAISSGAIARMQNTGLASSLVSWPTAIDDLIEEEVQGSDLVVFHFLPALSERVPLAEPYRLRLRAPNVRGLDDISAIGSIQLAKSPHPNRWDPLYEDFAVENEILRLMIWAQAGLGEAKLFDQKLDTLMAELSACLNENSC